MIAIGFFLMIIAFGIAFFVLHFQLKDGSVFTTLTRSIITSFVWFMGGVDLDNLWDSSKSGEVEAVAMLLLVVMMVFGTLIMTNLIVATIITDMDWLREAAKAGREYFAIINKTMMDMNDGWTKIEVFILKMVSISLFQFLLKLKLSNFYRFKSLFSSEYSAKYSPLSRTRHSGAKLTMWFKRRWPPSGWSTQPIRGSYPGHVITLNQ